MKIDALRLLESGALHDTRIMNVRVPRAMRSLVFRAAWVQSWEHDAAGSLLPLERSRLHAWHFTFALGELASFQLDWLGQATAPVGSSLRDPYVALLSAVVDEDAAAIAAAEQAHGGTFHSLRLETYRPSDTLFVFRECRAEPSDYEAYRAWLVHPYWGPVLERSCLED